MNKVKEVIKVLEPIEEDITLLGGEKFSTGSAVLPVLNKLKKRLAPDENDLIYIAKLKKDITEDMEKRCSLNLNKKVLAKSSFFDKRFEKLKIFILNNNFLFFAQRNCVRIFILFHMI